MIQYNVRTSQGGHRYHIRQTISQCAGQALTLYLPIWIPGSYTRRDFAKHIRDMRITADDHVLNWQLLDPSTWQVDVPDGCDELVLEYSVYARDISVRGCYSDDERGLFNPCCACLAVEGQENKAHRLQLSFDEQRTGWSLYGADLVDQALSFTDYDALIDTPLILGAHLDCARFEVHGKTHELIVSGAAMATDTARLVNDVRQICAAAQEVFGDWPAQVGTYRFMLHVTDNVYGGLEHRSSTLLMAPRRLLPRKDYPIDDHYLRLLGLCSHEYFHTWNIKDLKPHDYQPYDLRHEQPSEMLWLFEGFTAFFDNWLLVRSGVISAQQYWRLLAGDISNHLRRRGRHKQTLAHSSFEAWTKLYNGGEDAINSSTNYYVHGALFALCLDVFLRKNTHDQWHLPRVMRNLWQDYQASGKGLTEAHFSAFVREQLPADAHEAFNEFMYDGLHTTKPLPLEETLSALAMCLHYRLAKHKDEPIKVDPGFRWQKVNGAWRVSALDEASVAAAAGVAVDDVLVAVNQLQVSSEVLRDELQLAPENSRVDVHVFRDGVLKRKTFSLQAAELDEAHVEPDSHASAAAKLRLRQWLNLSLDV
ncbi:M61 family peptidase [Suttonella sp. R2A3]|uniref:M61 family metallopeptidase n=1 Tax=Suttonella sp. R2A3 TaxID=2908648 RepID=UPI001F37461C|nr:M61 family peptidase [Suttonella sp. R2A3]UJF24947.1 M61 family peptidase [Suttonella sp. R2A3]